ncbi:MAG: large-conductance mechanosensitive channel protein MscL [Ruminococcaceae bacterium]|nr:large-conductance mechanosensitive channel protein MscL [Oscillospiraceae bacterium]
MWEEFKKFAFKGNVIDMAVGVVVGGAFSTIVNSLVKDIIMPVFGFITAGMDFTALKVVLSEATETKPEAAILYGTFIQNIISFLIIAFSIFMVVKGINKAASLRKAPEPEVIEEAPKAPTQEELLAEIRDLIKASAPTPALEEAKEN